MIQHPLKFKNLVNLVIKDPIEFSAADQFSE